MPGPGLAFSTVSTHHRNAGGTDAHIDAAHSSTVRASAHAGSVGQTSSGPALPRSRNKVSSWACDRGGLLVVVGAGAGSITSEPDDDA